jgi:hypothetical protein
MRQTEKRPGFGQNSFGANFQAAKEFDEVIQQFNIIGDLPPDNIVHVERQRQLENCRAKTQAIGGSP